MWIIEKSNIYDGEIYWFCCLNKKMPEGEKWYAQTEQAWRFAEDKANDNKMLALGFKVADIHLNRTYLDNFSSAPILKPDLGL